MAETRRPTQRRVSRRLARLRQEVAAFAAWQRQRPVAAPPRKTASAA